MLSGCERPTTGVARDARTGAGSRMLILVPDTLSKQLIVSVLGRLLTLFVLVSSIVIIIINENLRSNRTMFRLNKKKLQLNPYVIKNVYVNNVAAHSKVDSKMRLYL